jgi:uncharacterized membrane protein (DUF485 family)
MRLAVDGEPCILPPLEAGGRAFNAPQGRVWGGAIKVMTGDEPTEIVHRVQADPCFRELVRRRARLAWSLTALMVGIYFGFILAIAYQKTLLSQPLAGGVTTIGIPLGIGVIVSAFVLTGIYVRKANSTFDQLTEDLRERLKV